jgi:antirestriction protein ArdC
MRRSPMSSRTSRNILCALTAISAANAGDEGYAAEEIVAEFGAAFICADLYLTPEVRDDHASYISRRGSRC